jgi:hypothetical protein
VSCTGQAFALVGVGGSGQSTRAPTYVSACFSLGARVPAAIRGDEGTAAADPNQPPGLHGAGAEGTGQSCPCCTDAAHICGIYSTWHWWAARE